MFAQIKKRRYERDVRVQLIAMFGEIGEKHAEKRSEAVDFQELTTKFIDL